MGVPEGKWRSVPLEEAPLVDTHTRGGKELARPNRESRGKYSRNTDVSMGENFRVQGVSPQWAWQER